MNLEDVEAIEAQYKLRNDLLATGDHKSASSAHVEFHRLVYRHWPAIFKALTPGTSCSSVLANVVKYHEDVRFWLDKNV